MLRIGLTGGIGSGKSTVAKALSKRGFHVIDADQIARDIVEPGGAALGKLAEAFGADILDDTGALNRGELARRAFVDAEHTELLNSITHPEIEAESERRFLAAEEDGEPVAIYDMPLLVEKGYHEDMDLTIVVDVEPEERVRRLVEFRGLKEEDARARMKAQISDADRLAVADIVVDNNGDVETLEPQVDEIAQRLQR